MTNAVIVSIVVIVIIVLIILVLNSSKTKKNHDVLPPVPTPVPTTSLTKVLKNADFKYGTYRIKKPGNYVLGENIIFNPVGSTQRADVPANGFWFAGISIECKGVFIDANGFDFRLSEQYAASNVVNVFTTILLGNNLFAGNLFGLNGSKYPDTDSYFGADDVTIQNLKMSYSSHFAIRGSGNDNITIRNCHFENFHITAISIQGSINLTIDHCTFLGSTIPIPSNNNQTGLHLLKQTLTSFSSQNVPGAQAQLNALETWVDANPSRFEAGEVYPGTLYGIFVSAGATAVFRIPMNEATNGFSQFIADGRECENVTITNCIFKDFIISPTEKISVGTNIPQPANVTPFPGVPLPVMLLSFFGAFGQIQWRDVYPNGTFEPNPFAQAFAFAADLIYPQLGPSQGLLPANTADIMSSIVNSDETLFNNNAAPMGGFDGDLIKGLFGIRAVGVTNLTLDNIFMENFQSIGPSATDLTTLSGYGSITPQPVVRNRQNDVWFVSTEVCENVKITNSYWDGLLSEHGWVFGLANDNSSNYIVENSIVKNLTAAGSSTSVYEPDGEVFGYTAVGNTSGVTMINVTTEDLAAVGGVTPFPAPGPTVTLINAIAL